MRSPIDLMIDKACGLPSGAAVRSSDLLGVGKLEVWAYGGGTQSVGIAALIVQGKLPVPDWTVIADTEYERSSTWQYMNDVTVPAMEKVGVKIHRLLKSDYCYDHAGVFNSKGTPLIPAFTNQTVGNVGKLSGFCNRWWKQDVMLNFFRREHKLARSSMRKWIGYSLDESIRAIRMMDGDEWKSGLLRFPLIHDHPMKRRDTIAMVEAMGWPTPPRSACWMCPNQSDAEWRDLKQNYPDEFRKAVELEKDMQKQDPHLWLHDSCVPLDTVNFERPDDLFYRACDSGACFT